MNLDELERLADAATPWEDPFRGHPFRYTIVPERELATRAYVRAADPSTVKALIARIRELETLDVERLARALHNESPETHRRRACRERHDIRAAAIAAEYAALDR